MQLICPECKIKLLRTANEGYRCNVCGSFYPVVRGIPSFLTEVDNFYEGRFVATQKNYNLWLIKVLLPIYHAISISSSRERFMKKAFKKASHELKKFDDIRILDLGCGGGREELAKFGEVTGIDVSFKSLIKAKRIYRKVIHANINAMPFEDEYFDIVFSTDVLGHIQLEKKDRVLSEVLRVTRKGGFSIHSFECDSESIFFKWAKTNPDLYQKYFIKMYGHFGLEPHIEVFKRFRDIGFFPIIEVTDPTKGYIREVSSYIVFFDNEYKEFSRVISPLVAVCKLFSSNRYIRIGTNFILGMFVPAASLVTPKNHRDSVKVVYRKPSLNDGV